MRGVSLDGITLNLGIIVLSEYYVEQTEQRCVLYIREISVENDVIRIAGEAYKCLCRLYDILLDAYKSVSIEQCGLAAYDNNNRVESVKLGSERIAQLLTVVGGTALDYYKLSG